MNARDSVQTKSGVSSLLPLGTDDTPTADRFVVIRVAGGIFALRSNTLAGFATDREVVPLPGSESSLLGVTSVRGRVFPVFGLAELLGLSSTGPARWLAWVAGEQPAGFAFAGLEGVHRVASQEVREGADAWSALRGTIDFRGSSIPVIDLSRAARAGFGRQAAAARSRR